MTLHLKLNIFLKKGIASYYILKKKAVFAPELFFTLLIRSFDGCFKFYSSSVPVQAAGKRAVLPLMGDALEAFSSPFKPENKQLRKLEGGIQLFRLLGPLPGGGFKGLR